MDAISFLANTSQKLNSMNEETYTWQSAREQFVECFGKLASKSQAQIGNHGSISYADLHSFVINLTEKDSKLQSKVF
jgi:hypothetical protein